jgi:nucleoside 2-deoxyribosyltransferase
MMIPPIYFSRTPNMTRKILYLASPYGFSGQQKALLLPPIVQALEALGAEVWEPFERNNQVDLSRPGWAYQVAQADLNDVKNCDGIFAIVNGTPPDEGVMVELGVAIALNKAIFLFRDDFRRCTDSEQYPLNLMLFAGLPEAGWENYFYNSVEEIGAPDKALWDWLTS